MMLWVCTAAAVLAVTILYFIRLNDLYEDLDSGQPNRALDKVATSGTDPAARQGQEADEPGPGAENTGDGEDPAGVPAAEQTGTDDQGRTDSGEEESKVDLSGGYIAPEQLEWDIDSPEELDPSKPIIALSFDDGPGRYTERIIQTLKDNDCKATFFMVGYNIEYYPARVRLIYESGMEVANHTKDHAQLTSGTDAEIVARIYENEALINSIVPVGQVLVRPPYGSYTDHTGEIVDRPMINWSVDSEDWKSKDKDATLEQIKANVKDGYIILMHEIHECTADALEELLPWLKEQGYQVTTVGRMFAARGVELERGHVYRFVHTAR